MRIRDYEDSDLAAVLAIVRSVLAEYGFSPDVGGLEADLRTIGERYAGERAGFWVAEDAGAVVGTVALRVKDADTCELKRLYVRADTRGSGVGRALYAHAEAFARRAGYARIWLDSSRRFTQARKLYERNGFVLLREIDNDWEDNEYEKRLVP